jgi:hypothetical protein
MSKRPPPPIATLQPPVWAGSAPASETATLIDRFQAWRRQHLRALRLGDEIATKRRAPASAMRARRRSPSWSARGSAGLGRDRVHRSLPRRGADDRRGSPPRPDALLPLRPDGDARPLAAARRRLRDGLALPDRERRAGGRGVLRRLGRVSPRSRASASCRSRRSPTRPRRTTISWPSSRGSSTACAASTRCRTCSSGKRTRSTAPRSTA